MNRSWMFIALLVLVTGAVHAQEREYTGVSVALPTGSTAISQTGLVSAYDMETLTKSGALRDFAVAGNHGHMTNLSPVSGQIGNALRFAWIAHRIHLDENPSLDLDGPLTIAIRIKPTKLGLHQHVFVCDDKFVVWITPENRIRFSDTLGSGFDSSITLETNTWYSVVATVGVTRGQEITRDNTHIYVNGRDVTGASVNRFGNDPPRWQPGELYDSAACYIGFESHQGMESHRTLPLHADIDELLLFERALNEDEIVAFSSN